LICSEELLLIGRIEEYISEMYAPAKNFEDRGDIGQLNSYSLRIDEDVINITEALKKSLYVRNSGRGIFVKRLDIPSWDPLLPAISFVPAFLPACNM
jgi:hypothetical protein